MLACPFDLDGFLEFNTEWSRDEAFNVMLELWEQCWLSTSEMN